MKTALGQNVAFFLWASTAAILFFAVMFSLLTDVRYDGQDMALLAIPAGLNGYALRLIFGRSPWADIRDAAVRLVGPRSPRDN